MSLAAVPSGRQSDWKGSFLVLASDGVWEFMSSQDVVDIVGGCLCASSRSEPPASGKADLMLACEAIVEASLERWKQKYQGQYIDDITVVIARVPEAL